jgi:anti-sigma B factor antagonist
MSGGRPGQDGELMAARADERVTVNREDGRTIAALSGEFDMAATFTVEPALERAVAEPGTESLTVDLSRLSFIDSTGMGVLLRTEAEARRLGIEVRFVPGPREVQRVFEIAGLLDVLPFDPEA